MDDVEYVLRIILRARDEMARVLAKARTELRGFATDAGKMNTAVTNLNAALTKFDGNLGNITKKLEAWRATLRETDKDGKELAKTFDTVGKNADASSKKVGQAVKAQDDLNKSANRLRSEYEQLAKQEHEVGKEADFAKLKFEDIGRRLEALAKQVEDHDLGRFWTKWARDAKSSAAEIKNTQDSLERELQALEKQAQSREDRAQQSREQILSRRKVQEQQRQRLARESLRIEREGADPSEIRRLSSEYDKLGRTYRVGSFRAREFGAEAERLRTTIRGTTNDTDKSGSVFSRFIGNMKKSGDSVAGFDNQLRGMAILLAITSFEQLTSAAIALGGELVSLAGSAIMAGGALGGILAAGAAQALPVIGLLAGAASRVKSVMDAFQQSQLLQKAQFADAEKGAQKQIDKTNQLANAQDGASAAADNLAEARKNLTQAQKDGADQLEDLIYQEKQAALAAKGASLNVKEAQKALQDAIRGGASALEIQQRQQALDEARLSRGRAGTTARRATRDRVAAGGDVGNLESVQNAAKAVEDAQRSVDRTNRALDLAADKTDRVASSTMTAQANLNFLLSQLSPAERKLYTAFQGLYTNYKRIFSGTSKTDGIYGVIIDSFTRAVDGVNELLKRPDVVKAASDLAGEIGTQLNKVFDSFTTGDTLDQLLGFVTEAKANLGPLVDIVIDLGHAFINIAEAGDPALQSLLEFLGPIVDKFLALTEDKDKMEDFFSTGEKHLEAWLDLLLAVIGLFAALVGASADDGKKSIEDLTKTIQGWTQWLEDHHDQVVGFFHDAREAAEAIGGVVTTVGKALFRTFSADRVKNFAGIINDVVIPALVKVADFFGELTDKIAKFVDNPIGAEIAKWAIALAVGGKIGLGLVGIFGKIAGAVEGVGKALEKLKPLGKLLRIVAPAAGEEGAAGAVVANPIGLGVLAVVAAVVLLLDKLGLLDDAWREVKSAFDAFWQEVGPPLERLIDSFGELWDAIGEGEGAFALLKPIVKFLLDIGGIFARVFGRTLGRIIGGAIDVLSGLVSFISDILRGRWRDAWEDLKQIFRGFIRGFTAPLRALPELIWEIAKKIAPMFKRGINSLWDFLKGLPGRIGDLASDAANAFVDAFKNVGGDVIQAILGGLKDAGGFAKDIANAFIDLINWLLPDKIPTPGPDIPLPKDPIPHLAGGGPVPGGGSGDTVLAKLTPGEHVLTKGEVAAAGGHSAIFALRRMLGGGGQGMGYFQAGGVIDPRTGLMHGGGTAAPEVDDSQVRERFKQSTNERAEGWRTMWQDMLITTRRFANDIEAQFRDMRVNTSKSADRMYRDIRGSVADIQNSFAVRGSAIVDSWTATWFSLMQVTNDGLTYIGHETNKALKALGEKNINFGLTKPKATTTQENLGGTGHLAGGGIVGSLGQRGRDKGLYALGAGEAVLNWAHQRYVEPAMNAFYGHGLGEMFNRTSAYHAGGPGQLGLAGGGYTFAPIPGMPGEEANTRVIPLLVRLIKKYHAIVTDAFDRDHSAGHKSPGHNITGTAADMVPAAGDWNAIEAMGKWAVGQGMIVGYGAGVPGSQPWPGHGRGLHIHIELGSGGGAAAAAKVLTDVVSKVGRPVVHGAKALADLSQAALDKVLKAANAKLAEMFAATSGGATDFTPGDVGPGAGPIFKFFRDQGFSDEQAAAWVGNFQQESGLNPSIVQPNGEGHGLAQWGGGRFAALMAFAKSHGKPWTDSGTQLAFVMHELSGPEAGAMHAIKAASTVEDATNAIGTQYERYGIQGDRSGPARDAFAKFAGKYDQGGIVPGGDGTPRTILAHAGEWILNKGQQARAAMLAGLSIPGLKSLLGFWGGPSGFQGGGVPDSTQFGAFRRVDRTTALQRSLDRGLDSYTKMVNEIVDAWDAIDKANRSRRRHGDSAKKINNAIGRAITQIDKLVADDGILDRMSTEIAAQFERANTKLRASALNVGKVVTRSKLTDIAISEQTLANLVDNYNDLVGERGTIHDGLKAVNAQLAAVAKDPKLSKAQKRKLTTELTAQKNLLIPRLDELDKQLVDAAEARLQAQIDAEQAVVDEITKRHERIQKGFEIAKRIASALGNEAGVTAANQQIISDMQANMGELQGRLAAATAAGATDLHDALVDQIADLNASIIEASQQMIKDAADAISTAATRERTKLDLFGRMADALGVVGDAAAAVIPGLGGMSRAQIAQGRVDVARREQAGLIGVRDQAVAAGNQALVQDLNDKINELTVTIAENTKAVFDARVAAINSGHDYTQSMADLELQLVDLDGQISGQVDLVKKANLLSQKDLDLRAKGNELTALLAEATPGTQAYRDLQRAILENEIATRQNTIALNEVTGAGSAPSTFSSTAWQWFRSAFLTGTGGIMPQYTPPGGMVSGPGGATGAGSTTNNNGRTTITNIEINEAGGEIDPTKIAGTIVFAQATAQ